MTRFSLNNAVIEALIEGSVFRLLMRWTPLGVSHSDKVLIGTYEVKSRVVPNLVRLMLNRQKGFNALTYPACQTKLYQEF